MNRCSAHRIPRADSARKFIPLWTGKFAVYASIPHICQMNYNSLVHTAIYIQSYILAMSDRIFACDVET